MRRALDTKGLRTRADAKVNHYMGLDALVEAGREFSNRLPLRRQHVRLQIAVVGFTRGQRLGEPAGRVLGDAGIGAKTGNEDA